MADLKVSSHPLIVSSGSSFGRAYDPSEIVGDEGFSTSLEIRYNNIALPGDTSIQPFAYADFGKVWNRDAGQPKNISGATAGAGFRFFTPLNINVTFTMAQPLTKDADAPQYGNGKNPRYLFSLSASF